MAQSYHQASQQGIWMILGPPTACAVQLAQPLVVTYADGAADSLPAHTPALTLGGTTQVDRTGAVWITYVQKGDPTLRIVPEQQLAALSADYAPLARVLADRVVPYQPQQPGGTAVASGAWSGGATLGSARAWNGAATYGAFDAHSWSGAATVSGVPFIATSNNLANTMSTGFFVKVASAPASDMALFDLDSGINGYLRVKVTSALHIIAEMSWAPGATGPVDAGGGNAITPGVWYWVTTGQWDNDPGYHLSTAVYVPGGATLGGNPQSGWIGSGTVASLSATAQLNIGHATSTSWLPFPTTSGNEMSKLALAHGRGNGAILGPPASDPAASGYDALYLARQAVGSAASLVDSTTNAFNAAAAPALNILSDGPYP